MTTVIDVIQGILVAICAGYVILFAVQKNDDYSKGLLICSFLTFIQNAGYFLACFAHSLDAELNSVRIEYIGSAFFTTAFMIFCSGFCKVKLSKAFFALMLLWDLFAVICVWSCEFHELFYRDLGVRIVDGSDHIFLKFKAGIVYLIHIGLVLIQLLICAFLGFRGAYKNQNRRLRKTCLLISIASLIPFMMLPLQMAKLTGGYDLMPASTVIGLTLLCVAAFRQRVFEVTGIANEKLLFNMKEGVIVVDTDYKFISANDYAVQWFPTLKSLIMGQKLGNPQLEEIIRKGTDTEIVIGDNICKICMDDIVKRNKKIGICITVVDLTEERKRLEEMEKLKEAAEKASRAKTTFLARMSHEIRTPINAIIGMNELIFRETGEDSIRQYSADIKTSADSLLGIVNDILDNSKIESGKFTIANVNYRTAAMINDVYQMMLVKADEKKLELIFDVDENLPRMCVGDDLRIKQILINLINNAIKYTSEGYVKLKIRGTSKDDKVILKVSVNDTGIGIRDEDKDALFEEFGRIDEEKNRGIEGTGLGLPITYQLLSIMGSNLNVYSEYGKGSMFYFEIEQGVADPEPMGRFTEINANIEHKTYKSFMAPDARILVVDDNAINRKVFVGLLKNTNMQMDEADSGKKCIELSKKRKYDIIFLDHLMPEIDGIETFKIMRADADNVNIDTPIIMLTANASNEAREQYLGEGFDDFISKPINFEELENIVLKYLDESMIVTQSE